ncbi:hypothetical protein KC19_2G209000 [Ceratodon purpureus]|uniref:Uncharacterized protein n=1 Tax=Ceratodon purpureus TaxID=3225 RepID=A0A8T0IYN9_CERPU|nr:hypothetical protein KC19_2G209000 [Ceratodon purpureus]
MNPEQTNLGSRTSQPETPRLPISTPINHNRSPNAYIPKKKKLNPPTTPPRDLTQTPKPPRIAAKGTHANSATSIPTPTPPQITHHHNPRQRSHHIPLHQKTN